MKPGKGGGGPAQRAAHSRGWDALQQQPTPSCKLHHADSQPTESVMRVAPPHELVLQGYLHKRSQHLRRWKVRFFMLSRRELRYARKSGQKPRGALAVADMEVVDDQNEVEHAGNFVLQLLTPGRRVFLSAATEKERDAWVAAIRELQAEAAGGVSGARHAHAALRSSSGLLSRPGSADSLATNGNAMLQGKSLGLGGGKKARVSKERKEERRRRRLPKLKEPFSAVWLESVIAFPREGSDSTTASSPMLAQVEALCFAGIPKEVRGRVWAWLLGNKLQINENLFKICKARAQAVQLEISLKRQTDRTFMTPPAPARTTSDMSTPATTGPNTPASMTTPTAQATEDDTLSPSSKLPKVESDTSDVPMLPLESRGESDEVEDEDITKTATTAASSRQSSTAFASDSSTLLQDAVGIADMLVAHGERSINLVGVDMPRTFGHHPLFKPGAEGTARTTEVLEAYTCYRPDLGYVQGMSYLAATLCFHMDSFTAFKALVALLSSSLLFDMFRLESRTFHYFAIYNQVFEYELPTLYRHFQESGIDAQMYAVDWALTLFTRSLPLNLALRIWDCYVLLGTPFFFQASMGVLALFEQELLCMQPEQIVRFLHNLPTNTSSRELFDAIDGVRLSCREISQLLAGGELWSPDSARAVAVTFPDSYE